MATRVTFRLLPRVLKPIPTLCENGWLTALEASLWLAAIASFVLYLRYSFEIYPVLNFNSDDAASLLFSSEMLKQHTLFPVWYSSTGLAWPLNKPESLLLPLFLVFSSDWMTCFRVAVAIDQLLMSALIWWLLGRAGLSRALRLFFFCLLFASLSFGMAEQTVMIGVQIWFYAKILLISFLVFQCASVSHAVENHSASRWFVSVFLVGAWLFVDPSYVSRIFPPLYAALAMMWAVRTDRHPPKAIFSAAGVLALAAVAGRLVARYLIPATTSYQLYSHNFVDLNAAGANFLLLLRGLMDLFGATPPVGADVYSVATAFWVLKLAILCITLLGPLWLLTQWRGLKNDFLRFLVIVFVGSFGLRVLVYVFTGISVGSVNTNRYFISVAFLGMTIMLLYFEEYWRVLPTRVGSLAVAVILIAASPLLVAKPVHNSQYQRLTLFLEGQHLKLGYATFWNAGVVTALSDDRLRVRQVKLGNGYIEPHRWLASPHWYRGDAAGHQSFLLLEGTERAFDTGSLRALLGKPSAVKSFGDYRVLIYPFDLALRLGWKNRVDEKLPAGDRRVAMNTVGTPMWSAADHCWKVTVQLTNLGDLPIGSDGKWPVNLGVHLLDPAGKLLDNDYARVRLPMIGPGKSATVVFETPDSRANGNIVEFDAVQENVAWFHQTGSPVLRVGIPKTPEVASEE